MLIARTQRIAAMSTFLALDYVLGFTPIPMLVWGLDFIMLFMVWGLCGSRLAVVWWGLSFLPTLPNLSAWGGVIGSTVNTPVQPQALPSWEVPVISFLYLWYHYMLPWVQAIAPWVFLATIIFLEFGFFKALRDKARYFFMRMAPVLKSRMTPDSFQSYLKLKAEEEKRKERRKLRKEKLHRLRLRLSFSKPL